MVEMKNFKRLPRSFFARDTHAVAKSLLGKLLVRKIGNCFLVGRITEVESYVGEKDKACHASRGKTKRNAVMFEEAGHAYVYLVYGMYDCLNVVTEKTGFPAAVLIRSIRPIAGIKKMLKNRDKDNALNLTNGPGKLTQAMIINRDLNGEDFVFSDRLFVADDGFVVRSKNIEATERIGVDYAGEDAMLKWRYVLKK